MLRVLCLGLFVVVLFFKGNYLTDVSLTFKVSHLTWRHSCLKSLQQQEAEETKARLLVPHQLPSIVHRGPHVHSKTLWEFPDRWHTSRSHGSDKDSWFYNQTYKTNVIFRMKSCFPLDHSIKAFVEHYMKVLVVSLRLLKSLQGLGCAGEAKSGLEC